MNILLTPARIGSVEIRNRIVMCPMGDALAESDGTVSARQIDHYEARARGGVRDTNFGFCGPLRSFLRPRLAVFGHGP